MWRSRAESRGETREASVAPPPRPHQAVRSPPGVTRGAHSPGRQALSTFPLCGMRGPGARIRAWGAPRWSGQHSGVTALRGPGLSAGLSGKVVRSSTAEGHGMGREAHGADGREEQPHGGPRRRGSSCLGEPKEQGDASGGGGGRPGLAFPWGWRDRQEPPGPRLPALDAPQPT